MIERVFDACVRLLLIAADWLGMTYKEVNVWFFCVIWPIFTLVLTAIIAWQWLRIRRLKRRLGKARDS